MKVLLLIPSQYTLHNTIKKGFEKLGFKVFHYDFRYEILALKKKINVQIFRLPYKIRNIWEKYYMEEINRCHIYVYEKENPDIVFIYNSEMLLPETIQYFKQKSKIIFILGDNPYYTPMNDYYMHLLFYGDLIISPDSFWAEQLKLLGIKNIVLDFPGYDEEPYKDIEPTDEEREKYKCDVLFIGTGYPNAWGYKRALFLNHFTIFDLKVYGGRHFIKWFKFFPDLEKKFILKNRHIPINNIVKMHKSAKLYPVDANPAILNGVHLRVFDCVSMGVLPIIEYKKDIDYFFPNIEMPAIKNYSEIKDFVKEWLNNDDKREKKLNELKNYIKEKFSAEFSLRRILENAI